MSAFRGDTPNCFGNLRAWRELVADWWYIGSYSDRQVDHYCGLVDSASRGKGALPLGIDTALSAMVLTIESRSRSKSLA